MPQTVVVVPAAAIIAFAVGQFAFGLAAIGVTILVLAFGAGIGALAFAIAGRNPRQGAEMVGFMFLCALCLGFMFAALGFVVALVAYIASGDKINSSVDFLAYVKWSGGLGILLGAGVAFWDGIKQSAQ